MMVQSILENAVSILAESVAYGDFPDYEERTSYLLAAFCSEAREADNALRKFMGIDEPCYFDGIYLSLGDDFPLLDRFATPAALYLASMLVIDDAPELSDRIYHRYSDSMSLIYQNICGMSEGTVNKYFAE